MGRFTYTGYLGHVRQTGIMIADTQDQAADRLHDTGLVITRIKEDKGGMGQLFQTGVKRPLRLEDKIFLTQNLATFLGSGIPLVEALSMIAADTTQPKLAAILERSMTDLRAGKTFATSLSAYPDSFDPVFLALVDAGEGSGNLKQIFASLTDKLKTDGQTISKVKSALIYPAVIGVALILLGLVLAIFVLPRITVVFERFTLELPLLTRLFIGFSKALTGSPLATGAIVLTVLAVLALWVTSAVGKKQLRFIASKLPVFKDIFWYVDLERFSSTLALLSDAGVPIQEAIRTAGRTVSHPRLSKELPEAAEAIASGQTLAAVLGRTSLPHTVLSLLSVGEQSGTLSTNLRELADYYHDRLDESLRNLTALIEPVLTVVVGIVIGVVVIAIIVPIYQLVGQLTPAG